MKTLLLILTAGLAFGADGTLDAQAAFARLKSLAGEWQADTSMGKARLSYEVIGGGVALAERLTFDHKGEPMAPMLTVYHLDNGKLMLTHYCDLGNQPRLRAAAFDAATGEIRFEFLDISNAPDANASHMHSARLRIGAALFLADWDLWAGGTKKTTESFKYTRLR